ncbi:TPA: hypothetical protein U1B50_001790 [Streptococcus suis]|nr:hypothetical protein [Streptococcus suis]HEM3545232.1 hypothetical protein [Streptococcus suis]
MRIATVIKIIDPYTLIIDKGSESKEIHKDMKITIYEPGPEITGIDGESLGRYDFKKADLIITEVYPKFAIAKHVRENSSFSVSSILTGSGYTTKGTLDVSQSDITPLKPKSSQIQIGDPVKKFYE